MIKNPGRLIIVVFAFVVACILVMFMLKKKTAKVLRKNNLTKLRDEMFCENSVQENSSELEKGSFGYELMNNSIVTRANIYEKKNKSKLEQSQNNKSKSAEVENNKKDLTYLKKEVYFSSMSFRN